MLYNFRQSQGENICSREPINYHTSVGNHREKYLQSEDLSESSLSHTPLIQKTGKKISNKKLRLAQTKLKVRCFFMAKKEKEQKKQPEKAVKLTTKRRVIGYVVYLSFLAIVAFAFLAQMGFLGMDGDAINSPDFQPTQNAPAGNLQNQTETLPKPEPTLSESKNSISNPDDSPSDTGAENSRVTPLPATENSNSTPELTQTKNSDPTPELTKTENSAPTPELTKTENSAPMPDNSQEQLSIDTIIVPDTTPEPYRITDSSTSTPYQNNSSIQPDQQGEITMTDSALPIPDLSLAEPNLERAAPETLSPLPTPIIEDEI